jgi:hypothetical protein
MRREQLKVAISQKPSTRTAVTCTEALGLGNRTALAAPRQNDQHRKRSPGRAACDSTRVGGRGLGRTGIVLRIGTGVGIYDEG